MAKIERLNNIYGNGIEMRSVPGIVKVGYVPVPEGVVPTSTQQTIYFDHPLIERSEPVPIPQNGQPFVGQMIELVGAG